MIKIKNGILLAGGTGSRLFPMTKVVSKQLLNINGKFIIDYPINTLKQLGIENLTIIVGSSFSGQILDYIQDGSDFGINVNYCYQQKPEGISHAINLCKRYLTDHEQFAVLLGDNIFQNKITLANAAGAQIILNKHPELNRFGVASIKNDKIIKIEEKPKIIDHDLDNYAITGCYIFDQKFFEYFAQSKKSNRGEYEIVDIINAYDNANALSYSIVDGKWVDAGTFKAIEDANEFMK